jgi:hypothetical protein
VRPLRPAQQLRIAIDCLPLKTRQAMLGALESNRIIVGAYVDRSGGVCPMLAAHRNGGRTNVPSFARAWDRYTRARKPRPATERELRTLRTMLEASVALDEPGLTELSQAIAEHREASAKRGASKRSGRGRAHHTGERDRTPELRTEEGWAWTRPFRRLDDFELTVRELRAMERQRERRREPELV